MTDVTHGVLHTLFHSDQGGHEQVVLCQDRASGLKAVIAIHSTALGPALGGTRFYPYATEEEAVVIVAAMEALWPKPVIAAPPHPGRRSTTWRFSGRWWSKPVASRRERP